MTVNALEFRRHNIINIIINARKTNKIFPKKYFLHFRKLFVRENPNYFGKVFLPSFIAIVTTNNMGRRKCRFQQQNIEGRNMFVCFHCRCTSIVISLPRLEQNNETCEPFTKSKFVDKSTLIRETIKSCTSLHKKLTKLLH